ncbi:MAG TPA: nuclear transport factor 2 family protein [Solirubrobacterales bacterium]
MPSDRIAVVQRFLDRWIAGDRTVRDDEVHPDAELHTRLAAAAGEPYRGREGIERWGRDLGDLFEQMDLTVEEMIETDTGAVLVISTAELSARGSDVTFTQPLAWLFSFRDDLPARMDVFQSHAEGRKAAGLL